MIERHLPIRKLTRLPGFHWFGYYDKLEFDPSGRYVLGMEVAFEGRSPTKDDAIRIGIIDLADGDKWIELGSSGAWCWQQGCMLQWLPGSDREIIWNDREEDRYVSRILNVETGTARTIPHPIYTVSPDGRTAVTPDFRRINEMRPGYGYAGIPDPHADQLAPGDSGIWRVDLQTGDANLIVTLAQIAAVPYAYADLTGSKHWFNHLLFNPDGLRFAFLHRWRGGREGRGWDTRMFSADGDGGDIRLVTDGDGGTISHFIWADPQHLNIWTGAMEGFALFTDDPTGRGEPVLHAPDGHQSYLPGGKWMIYDAYPREDRLRSLMLYNTESAEVFEIGRFASPPEYTGELRCDLHPRFSPDGRKIVIDSVHDGDGRQMYMLDISGIVGR